VRYLGLSINRKILSTLGSFFGMEKDRMEGDRDSMMDGQKDVDTPLAGNFNAPLAGGDRYHNLSLARLDVAPLAGGKSGGKVTPLAGTETELELFRRRREDALIGFQNGQPVYAIAGGADDDEGDEGADDGEGDGDGDGDSNDGDSNEGDGEGDSNDGDGDGDSGGDDGESPEDEINRLKADLAAANTEAGKRRKGQRELEQKIKDLETANLTDEERDTAERKSLAEDNARLTEAARRGSMRDAIDELNGADGINLDSAAIKTAIALINQDDLDFNEYEVPTNMEAVLRSTIQANPILTRSRGKTGGKGSGGSTNAGQGETEEQVKLTTEELERATESQMSPERFAAMKDVKSIDDYRAADKKHPRKRD
jgi:hypothetical protein